MISQWPAFFLQGPSKGAAKIEKMTGKTAAECETYFEEVK